jgi:tetratricopeptide (TPR) repeat protein
VLSFSSQPGQRRLLFAGKLVSMPRRIFPFLIIIVLLVIQAVSATTQQKVPQASRSTPKLTPKNQAQSAAAKARRKKPGTAAQELQRRFEAARFALQSGDPSRIIESNQRLIALSLREMARVRSLQNALPQSAELYKQSLNVEESPDARIDLAIVYSRAGRAEDAIFESQKVLFSYPEKARAWHVQGEAYIHAGNLKAAIEALERSVAIQPDLNVYYTLAASYLMMKEKAKADATFQKIIADKDTAVLHVMFGDAYGEAGYPDDSLREYLRALELDPDLPHGHFFAGLAYLRRNEWAPNEEAFNELKKEVRQYPTGYFGNYYMGALLSGYQRYEESNKYLDVALKAKSDVPEPWLYLGLNAAALEKPEKAQEYLNKAIELTGEDEARNGHQIRRAYIALGRIEVAKGNKKKGTELLNRAREMSNKHVQDSQTAVSSMAAMSGMGGGAAIAPVMVSKEEKNEMRMRFDDVDPTAELDASVLSEGKLKPEQMESVKRKEKELRGILSSAYNDWGTAEARQQQYEAALQRFQEAEKWDASTPGLMRNLGFAAFRAGALNEAVRALQIETTKNKDPKLRSMLAAALMSRGDVEAAVKEFKQLGELIYADPRLAYGYAMSLAKVNNPQEATVVLNRLMTLDPPPEMLLQIGQVYGDIGDDERALVAFKKAAQADPNLQGVSYNAGLALIHLNRSAEAVSEFEMAVKQNAEDVAAQYNLAFALLQIQQRDRAMTVLRDLVRTHPDHALGHYQLGKELLLAGQADKALPHLEKAVALDPTKEFIHFQLQAAYRKKGRTEEAERELKIYRELKAKSRERKVPGRMEGGQQD